MLMQKVRKSGNSYVVTIPREEMERRGLHEGDIVALEVRKVDYNVRMDPEVRAAFERVMAGEATPVQVSGLLIALRVKGETAVEVAGVVSAMREAMVRLPADKPLTCVAYIGGPSAEAFIEPVGIGDVLPDMPLFLTPDVYVSTPLDVTYRLAWDGMAGYWRDVLSAKR